MSERQRVGPFDSRTGILARRDLTAFLSDFVAARGGLRFGRMFGAPAVFAGRRLFCCAVEDGLIARLPPAFIHAALAQGARQSADRTRSRDWVIFSPRTAHALAALTPFLEVAARHVAMQPTAIRPPLTLKRGTGVQSRRSRSA